MRDDSTTAALMRHHRREAARLRLRESQREDLFQAARILIPEHGIAIALGRIAVHAGLTRHAAQALFNTTTDLACELVRRARHALIEATAPQDGATPLSFVTRLIEALRADAPADRIRQALSCGAPAWQREALAAAEDLLSLAIGEGLRATAPAIPLDQAARLGHRVLALANQAAFAPDAAEAGDEAAVIVAMLAPLIGHQAIPKAAPRAAARPWTGLSASFVIPPEGLGLRLVSVSHPPARVHDPPAHAA